MTAHSLPPAHHETFFGPKTFAAAFRVQGKVYEIDVRTPDLSQAPTRMWADWGPMYTCDLGPSERVHITYCCPVTGRRTDAQLNPPSIEVDSPARFGRREERPFYLQIDDTARNLRLQAYMDADGEVREVEARPLSPTVNVAPLLFRASAQPASNDAHAIRDVA